MHSRSRLPIGELDRTFVLLGCGDHITVIDNVVTTLARSGATLPPSLSKRLMRWVSAYAEHTDYHRLQMLVHRVEDTVRADYYDQPDL